MQLLVRSGFLSCILVEEWVKQVGTRRSTNNCIKPPCLIVKRIKLFFTCIATYHWDPVGFLYSLNEVLPTLLSWRSIQPNPNDVWMYSKMKKYCKLWELFQRAVQRLTNSGYKLNYSGHKKFWENKKCFFQFSHLSAQIFGPWDTLTIPTAVHKMCSLFC